MSDFTPQTAERDSVTLDNETYTDLLEAADESTQTRINESGDKITLKTQVKRGDGTRDQDKTDVKVKGDDPEETASKLAETLDALEKHGIADTLRETQPGDN